MLRCFALILATIASLVSATTSPTTSTISATTVAPIPAGFEDWAYSDVRPGSHMFWWFYSSTNYDIPRENIPLILWLQGGPGGSSIGYGDFTEFGPLDINLQPRNTTWIQVANVIFLDQPVGTGWSYVDDPSLLVRNNSQIAIDVVSMLKDWFNQYPGFQSTPFFIFSESYGGKMTVGIANALLAAVDAGEIKTNFRGVALGDSWISGVDSVLSWGPVLKTFSEMTEQELDVLNTEAVQPCAAACAAGNWSEAINQWGHAEGIIDNFSCVDFYNLLNENCDNLNENPPKYLTDTQLALADPGIKHDILQRLYARHVRRPLSDPVDDLMNGPIRIKLNAGPRGKVIPDNVTFGGGGDVFGALSNDFMRPVLTDLDQLLSSGRINVTVYEGQLDLICSPYGAELWMHKLQWAGMPGFYATKKTAYAAWPGAPTGAFRRSFINNGPGGDGGSLNLWNVLRAGHLLPMDNGDMALRMVSTILDEQSK